MSQYTVEFGPKARELMTEAVVSPCGDFGDALALPGDGETVKYYKVQVKATK